MKKRVLCFLLSAVILLGMVTAAAPQVFAVSAMKASDDCIAIIKELEGFRDKAYFDYNHWAIGYGTQCEKNEYPNGITPEKGEQLLRKALETFERSVNNFIERNNLTLSQNQYDALVSFTYNLGSDWMNDRTHMFTDVVISGVTGNVFLFSIARWSTVIQNGVRRVEEGLVRRRLIEANMYLNGVYSTTLPENYRYVLYDNNLEGVANEVRVQAFDTKYSDIVRAEPTKAGYYFLGWYTKAEGGEWVTFLGPHTTAKTLYGHWQKGSGERDANGNVVGVAANYACELSGVPVFDNPGGKEIKKLGQNTRVTIVADYMDANQTKWGKLSDGGWVDLTHLVGEDEPEEFITVRVMYGGVNIRRGPGTNYAKKGTATKGQELNITAVVSDGKLLWGKFADGWISLMYTNFDEVIADDGQTPEEDPIVGVIKGTDKLNVRIGPGTAYEVVGSLKRGDRVTVTEQKKVGKATWGHIKNGWISMYYVEILADAEPDPTAPAGTVPTEPDQTPDPTEPAEKPDEPGDTVVATGTVVSCNSLRIRAGAGTSYPAVGSLALGTQVKLYEMTTVGSQVWGRIDAGWICLNYVSLDAPGDPGGDFVGATVVKCSKLNVRTGAGVAYARVCQLPSGTKVRIYEQTKVGSTMWARIDEGWVSMDYLRLDSESGGSTGGGKPDVPTDPLPSEPGKKQSGTVVKTDVLRVREAPGAASKQVGTLKRGDRVVILETAKVGKATWGRTAKGWISLYYVQLDKTELPEGSFVGTVTAAGLRIREAAGTGNKQVGTYTKGTQVVILETTKVGNVTWGRTDKGWVSLYYISYAK